MDNLEIGQEVFYIHKPYDELPMIRKGVVVKPPSDLFSPDWCSIRPIKHKTIFVATVHLPTSEVFLTEATTFPMLSKVIDGRIDKKYQEITVLRRHWHDLLEKLLKSLDGEED